MLFHDFLLVADERAGHVLEARQHLQPHLVAASPARPSGSAAPWRPARRARASPRRRSVDLARAPLDARVGGVDAVDIGVDVAALGLQRRGERHGRGVRAAAPERRDAPVGAEPLKARDDGVQPLGEFPVEVRRVDLEDPRRAVRARGADRHLPALPGARRHVELLQRQRHQPGGHLLAAGDHRVVFARVIEAAAVRAGG